MERTRKKIKGEEDERRGRSKERKGAEGWGGLHLRKAEIRDLDLPIRVVLIENVLGLPCLSHSRTAGRLGDFASYLEIAMNYSPRMHVPHCLQDLQAGQTSLAPDSCTVGSCLTERVCRFQLGEGSSLCYPTKHLSSQCHLHHDVEDLRRFEPIYKPDDARVIYLPTSLSQRAMRECPTSVSV